MDAMRHNNSSSTKLSFRCWPDRLEHFFRFGLRSRARPDNPAHFFQVQIFGEWRSRWDGKKSEETIQIVRSVDDEITVPFHHVRGLAQLVEHRAAIDHVDLVE